MQSRSISTGVGYSIDHKARSLLRLTLTPFPSGNGVRVNFVGCGGCYMLPNLQDDDIERLDRGRVASRYSGFILQHLLIVASIEGTKMESILSILSQFGGSTSENSEANLQDIGEKLGCSRSFQPL